MENKSETLGPFKGIYRVISFENLTESFQHLIFFGVFGVPGGAPLKVWTVAPQEMYEGTRIKPKTSNRRTLNLNPQLQTLKFRV